MSADPDRRRFPGGWLAGIRGNVLALGGVSLLNDASSEMIYPLLPLFVTTVLGGGPAALGVIEGIAESTASLLKMASGHLSDRMRRRKGWTVGGYLVSNLARPLIALASGWGAVAVLRFADRVGKGVRTAPRDALIAESTSPEYHGKAFGFHRAADHAGAVLGPILASLLLVGFHEALRPVFFLSIIPGLAAVALLMLAVREVSAARPAVPAQPLSMRHAWREMPPALRRFTAIVFLFTLGNSTDAFLLLKAQYLGVPIAWIPILWVVLHLVKMASAIPGGIFSDRWGRKGLILGGWLVYALTYAGFMIASAPWHAWALFAFYGLFFGLTEGVEKALVADLAPEDRRGTAFGLYHLAVGLAALPASILFGWVWQAFGDTIAFGMGAALALAAGLLLAMLPLKR